MPNIQFYVIRLLPCTDFKMATIEPPTSNRNRTLHQTKDSKNWSRMYNVQYTGRRTACRVHMSTIPKIAGEIQTLIRPNRHQKISQSRLPADERYGELHSRYRIKKKGFEVNLIINVIFSRYQCLHNPSSYMNVQCSSLISYWFFIRTYWMSMYARYFLRNFRDNRPLSELPYPISIQYFSLQFLVRLIQLSVGNL